MSLNVIRNLSQLRVFYLLLSSTFSCFSQRGQDNLSSIDLFYGSLFLLKAEESVWRSRLESSNLLIRTSFISDGTKKTPLRAAPSHFTHRVFHKRRCSLQKPEGCVTHSLTAAIFMRNRYILQPSSCRDSYR